MCPNLSRLALCAAAVVFAVGEARAAGGLYPDAFKKGIEAQDFGQWERSAELMRQAVLEMPEDGADVRIYGEKYRSYLPHYYRGLVYYKKGQCQEALEEWDKSLEIGAVRKTDELKALLKYHSRCLSGNHVGNGSASARSGDTLLESTLAACELLQDSPAPLAP